MVNGSVCWGIHVGTKLSLVKQLNGEVKDLWIAWVQCNCTFCTNVCPEGVRTVLLWTFSARQCKHYSCFFEN